MVRIHIIVLLFLFNLAYSDSIFYENIDISTGFYSGEVQGIKSVILQPNYFASFFIKKSVYSYRYEIFSKALYGDAKTGSGNVENRLLQIDVMFRFYKKISDLKNYKSYFGLSGEIYLPFGNLQPFITSVKDVYGAGENKVPTDKNYNFGLTMRFDGMYRFLFSSFEIVYYIYGDRVAPNLAPMSPLFGIFWENRVFLYGDFLDPVFSFFVKSSFFMQKKYDGNKIFTKHDFFAGTKREFDIEFGIDWYIKDHFRFFFVFYGYNNLNRGWSRTNPSAFRDGFYTGIGYIF